MDGAVDLRIEVVEVHVDVATPALCVEAHGLPPGRRQPSLGGKWGEVDLEQRLGSALNVAQRKSDEVTAPDGAGCLQRLQQWFSCHESLLHSGAEHTARSALADR